MNTKELIEQAVLHAMGFLEEDEAKAYEAAFNAAPPAVQAQVRREQTRLSTLRNILPDVDAPAHLRAIVLEAIRSEINAQEIAEAHRPQSGKGSDGSLAPRRGPMLFGRKHVAAAWRVNAIASMAAAIVFGVTTLHMWRQYVELESRLGTNAMYDEIAAVFGPGYVQDTLFSERTHRVVLTTSDSSPDTRGQAAVWYNPEWESVRFFSFNLPTQDGRHYTIALLDENGEIVNELARFRSGGGLEREQLRFDLPDAIEQGMQLAILSAPAHGRASGQPIMIADLSHVTL